jgi:hypothetical protein
MSRCEMTNDECPMPNVGRRSDWEWSGGLDLEDHAEREQEDGRGEETDF